jgi:hypothetical protein
VALPKCQPRVTRVIRSQRELTHRGAERLALAEDFCVAVDSRGEAHPFEAGQISVHRFKNVFEMLVLVR